ncbi:polyketide synthase dehydratase domain-containing protein, partial [Pelosinus baikalensis]
YLGESQVLAKLSLPPTVSHTRDQYIVHPSLLDSALQASIYLLMEQEESAKTMLPFALQEVEVIDRCTPAMWALIRYHTGSTNKDKIKKIDIDLCNEAGKMCIKIKGFSTRVLEEKAGAFETVEKKSVLLFHPCWKEKASASGIPPLYEQRLVILCEPDQKIQESIEGNLSEIQHLVLQCQEKGIEERFQA